MLPNLICNNLNNIYQFFFQFTRDWFVERLQYIVEDIFAECEIDDRETGCLTNLRVTPLSSEDTIAAEQFKELLNRGIQVLYHNGDSGSIVKANLYFDESNNRILVAEANKSIFSYFFDQNPTKVIARLNKSFIF